MTERAEDETKLEALRAAVQAGLDDVAAGRLFEVAEHLTVDELRAQLAALEPAAPGETAAEAVRAEREGR